MRAHAAGIRRMTESAKGMKNRGKITRSAGPDLIAHLIAQGLAARVGRLRFNADVCAQLTDFVE